MKIDKKVQEVFDKVIKAMENGKSNWTQSWTGQGNAGLPFNVNSRNHYNGINVWVLMMRQAEDNMPSQIWATYKQWETKGYQVKEGETGERIVFWKLFDAKDSEGNETGKTIPFLKSSVVFNESQLEGYKAPVETEEKPSEFDIQQGVEDYVSNTNATIKHSATAGAYYRPSLDYIMMPDRERFKDTKDADAEGNYYATLLHELVHWTGAEDRCNRSGVSKNGKDKDIDDAFRGSYAFEELVAEIGAAVQCCILGVTSTPKKESAQYLNSWIKRIEKDPDALFKATAKASQAVKFVEGLQETKAVKKAVNN